MRAFLGIDFDDDMKQMLSQLQVELKPLSIKARWKHRDNFHLTLKFFEEISNQQKQTIDEAVNLVCTELEPFRLGISEIGVFRGRNRDEARVLWLGLNGDTAELIQLAEKLYDKLHHAGFDLEKRSFTPHVTIGQDLKFNCPIDQLSKICSGFTFPEIVVDRLILFKSEQVGSKRIYTNTAEYKLGG